VGAASIVAFREFCADTGFGENELEDVHSLSAVEAEERVVSDICKKNVRRRD
jgi:hypothetical protein